MTAPMLLEIEALSTQFFSEDNVVRAVDGVTFAIAQGGRSGWLANRAAARASPRCR